MRRTELTSLRGSWKSVVFWVAWLQASMAVAAPNDAADARRKLLDQVGLRPKPSTPSEESTPEEDPAAEGSPEEQPEPEDDSAAEGSAPSESEGPNEKERSARAALPFAGALHQQLLADCKTCHRTGGIAERGGFVLTGDVTADHATSVRFVDRNDPGRSRLVRLAAGREHAGGALYAPGSSQLQRIMRWIEGGAALGTDPPAAAEQATPPPPEASHPSSPAGSPATASTTLASPEAEAPPVTAAVATSPAYLPTIHQLLSANCSTCHQPTGIAGRTRLVLTGAADADYAAARALVDPQQPESSLLLSKARGDAHATGPALQPDSGEYAALRAWVAAGAPGPTTAKSEDSAYPPVTSTVVPSATMPSPGGAPPAASSPHTMTGAPATGYEHGHHAGLALPMNLMLNGRFDLNYERRDFSGKWWESERRALRNYHRFLFLSRQAQDEPLSFTVELISLSFWEVTYRRHRDHGPYSWMLKLGKILVPFGPDPLFHQSYGGFAGFDQRVLPIIWAQEGARKQILYERGEYSFSLDAYAVRGHALRDADSVLNLQNDFSASDDLRLAFGGRARAAYGALSLYYSGYYTSLGFDRRLYLQALDLALWRWHGVPVLERFSAGLGVLRADVSGAGPGRDYYHFASYFRLRFYAKDWLYLQYRQGLSTVDNRRGTYVDTTRLTAEDTSTHNFAVVSRMGPLTLSAHYFLKLEKADEADDDFTRWTVAYEF